MVEDDAELVDLIYAATLGEKSWEDFLDRLAQTSAGGLAMIFAFDARRARQTVTILRGRPPETLAALQDHFGAINPYTPYCMAKPLGVGIAGDRMLSRERLVRTEFYNDFMLDNDVMSAVGLAVERTARSTVLISTGARRNDEAEQRRLAEQYTRLAPHLRRAAEFYRRNARAGLMSELGGALFDAIDVGVALISPDLRLLDLSETAGRLMGGAIAFDAAGRLRLRDESAQAALKAMCAPGYDGPQSLEFAAGDLRLSLVRISRGGVIGLFDDCGVALMVRTAAGLASHRDREAIGAAYGFTPAETRALEGVLAGRSVDEIARGAGRSRETIRSQIKSVYDKTGSTGRADLIRLMTGLRR